MQAAPAELTASLACDAVRAQADYQVARGNPQRAAIVLDEFLGKNAATASAMCWGARGQFSEQAGQLRDAVEYYRKSNRAYQRDFRHAGNPDAVREPPYQLHCMKLLGTLAGGNTSKREVTSPVTEKLLPEKTLGRPRQDTCD
ncbi:hypothetical protein M0222_08715 [Myxococcus fulvus]|nr:hypothetical protein [Myxococcus fulvus]